jgi:hypothetical protein
MGADDRSWAVGRVTTVAILALVLGLLSTASAAAEDCGPVTSSTVMTEARLACWDGWIIGDDITVDLGGHVVRLDRPILGDGSRLVLRNGTVDARDVPSTDPAVSFFISTDALITGLTVRNAPGIALELGERTIVRSNTFVDNWAAIERWYGGHAVIERNRFVGNRSGVLLQGGWDDRISDNRFERNDVGVNIPASDWSSVRTRIVSNHFDRNGFGVHLWAFVDASDLLIERNTIHRSGASGIAVVSNVAFDGPEAGRGGGERTIIRGNTVTGSGTAAQEVSACRYHAAERDCTSTLANDGITVLALDPDLPSTIVVSGNRTIRNVGHGIEAPGVTDGGGNNAAANGTSPGCLGVSCRGRG